MAPTMTEPTLTINRQLAKEAVEYLRASIHDSDSFHEKIYLRIVEQYLTLTDPTPLAAEHCREAGMNERTGRFIGKENVLVNLAYPGGMAASIKMYEPTVGQLRLALLQENRDGE